jgi:hypothetical protein
MLINHAIDLFANLNELAGKFQAATIQSMDSIYILNGRWNDFQLLTVNINGATINQYTVNSSPIDFGASPFINFIELEPLLSIETRMHSGTFSFIKFDDDDDDDLTLWFNTWISTDKLDSDCSDNSVSNLAVITSIKENEITDIVLYPNPTRNEVRIDYTNNFSYKIFDANGNLKLAQKDNQQQTIDMKYLPSGMYYIELRSADFNLIKKIVKY